MSSDTTIAGDVLNQQTHLAYKRMVKKKGVGIPCHFSKVCIFDLISLIFSFFKNPPDREGEGIHLDGERASGAAISP